MGRLGATLPKGRPPPASHPVLSADRDPKVSALIRDFRPSLAVRGDLRRRHVGPCPRAAGSGSGGEDEKGSAGARGRGRRVWGHVGPVRAAAAAEVAPFQQECARPESRGEAGRSVGRAGRVPAPAPTAPPDLPTSRPAPAVLNLAADESASVVVSSGERALYQIAPILRQGFRFQAARRSAWGPWKSTCVPRRRAARRSLLPAALPPSSPAGPSDRLLTPARPFLPAALRPPPRHSWGHPTPAPPRLFSALSPLGDR